MSRVTVAVILLAALAAACTSPATSGGRRPSTTAPASLGSPSGTASPVSPSGPAPRETGPPTAGYPDFWRVRHDQDPVDPRSPEMMRAIEQASDKPFVYLSGTDSGRWGTPYFEADPSTPQVEVSCPASPCFDFPDSDKIPFRIPPQARPSFDSDHGFVVIDRTPGVNAALWLWRACTPAACGRWTAHGMSYTSLDSDEIDRCWAQHYPSVVPASNLANFGHRGLPGLYLGIRYDEVATDRSIPHVLKIAVPNTASSHVYPYVGDESRGGDIPEGTLLRLKSSVDLSGLSRAARVIAEALKTYGAVVGDTSGAPVELKVENLVVERAPHKWSDVGISATSLSTLPLTDFEVVQADRDAPGPPPESCPNG
jgi:hypothetical protein